MDEEREVAAAGGCLDDPGELGVHRNAELSEPALRQVLEILAGVLAAAGLLFE